MKINCFKSTKDLVDSLIIYKPSNLEIVIVGYVLKCISIYSVEKIIDKNIQKWKVKAYVDDVDKFENHIQHEEDSKVFKNNSKQRDKNHGAIKNVNSVEKSTDGSFVITQILLDSSQISISFVENVNN